jgi:hypothetical protein
VGHEAGFHGWKTKTVCGFTRITRIFHSKTFLIGGNPWTKFFTLLTVDREEKNLTTKIHKAHEGRGNLTTIKTKKWQLDK